MFLCTSLLWHIVKCCLKKQINCTYPSMHCANYIPKQFEQIYQTWFTLIYIKLHEKTGLYLPRSSIVLATVVTLTGLYFLSSPSGQCSHVCHPLLLSQNSAVAYCAASVQDLATRPAASSPNGFSHTSSLVMVITTRSSILLETSPADIFGIFALPSAMQNNANCCFHLSAISLLSRLTLWESYIYSSSLYSYKHKIFVVMLLASYLSVNCPSPINFLVA